MRGAKKTHSLYSKEWVHLSITLPGTFPHPQKAPWGDPLQSRIPHLLSYPSMDYVTQDISIIEFLELIVKLNKGRCVSIEVSLNPTRALFAFPFRGGALIFFYLQGIPLNSHNLIFGRSWLHLYFKYNSIMHFLYV